MTSFVIVPTKPLSKKDLDYIYENVKAMEVDGTVIPVTVMPLSTGLLYQDEINAPSKPIKTSTPKKPKNVPKELDFPQTLYGDVASNFIYVTPPHSSGPQTLCKPISISITVNSCIFIWTDAFDEPVPLDKFVEDNLKGNMDVASGNLKWYIKNREAWAKWFKHKYGKAV